MLKKLLKKSKFLVKVYEGVFESVHWFIYVLKNTNWPSLERTHFSYGKLNRDKKFYVIKYARPECGIFSMILHLMPQIEYAVRKKYIPIIDCRETYLPILQDPENAGKENSWEYYFEQPGGSYSLDEVYQSKHVIYVRPNGWGIRRSLNYNDMQLSEKELHYWSALFNQYIRPNKDIQERICCEKSCFPRGQKILGVYVRAEYRWGGMVGKKLFYQHPKVADCDTFIALVEQKMNEWGYSWIFVSCDDREYSDKIARYFGDKCIRMDRPLWCLFENGVPQEEKQIMREYEKYTIQKKMEDYIVETYLLSQCDALFACMGTGAQYAYVINGGKYSHFQIYNDGLWTMEEIEQYRAHSK